MKKNILFILAFALILSSCEDLFTPAPENLKNLEQMYTDAGYAQGFIITAYRYIPTYYDNSEYATDDAVTNQKSNSFLKMATGTWASSNNPLDQWSNGFGAIQYLNLFLQNADSVTWAADPAANKLFNMRMKGEAYGLRALYMYYLLRNHAGFTNDGQLMGVPIITKFLGIHDDYNLPRGTFGACVKQIYQDLDSAERNLPVEYADLKGTAAVPAPFNSITTTQSVYNRVMGQYALQLFNGLCARAYRARTALLAASPAFNTSNSIQAWTDAADYAAKLIDYKRGSAGAPDWGLAANGVTYYANTSNEIDGISNAANPPEIIWRENIATNNKDQESQNFPPSLFGNGYMNPTQNLVDAFPMANGYPIDYTDQAKSGYNASSPYSGRDPRLAKYIVYNGNTEGVGSPVIYTGSASGKDGIGVKETSTRTGYYMKKRLRMDVNCNSVSSTGKNHINPRLRYTEMYLNYAEAANEAWGPKGTGTHAYSAYDIVKAIRKRALGIITDPYLDECAASPDKMRALIRNERRLELCFESFRFWDLRRWKANLTETARGMNVNGNVYTPLNNVEVRSYQDYMYYGPVPYSELLKYNKLVQNKGWK
ncbi:MAG: RagB/SusD family nutrient uptake outer membrane protein [Bacteroidota bacterium]|nr:RagB/SusD family nutrient uptake outer membrane protein [Bacteroidota bacterium]